jgi:organic radical activating enzyme
MKDAPRTPPLGRGEGRPVSQRTRTFRPNYLSFAGTFQCNLSCPHCCVPIEWADRLNILTAVRFLEQARAYGIEVLGFTGGEPFLYPEFLVALTQRASELGFRFDKLMTNGLWHQDTTHLETVLTSLHDASFTGKIGLSVDKFHGTDVARLAAFCRSTRRVFNRDTVLSLSYASRSPDAGLEPIHRLAAELDGVVEWSDLLNRYLLVSDDLTMTLNWNHLATVERAEHLPGNPWDGEWFEEDYCEGPGQALIVNPKGEVKPCCGFASDLDQLTIGNIHTDSVEEIVRSARNHPIVGTIFREGLTALRDEVLARDPDSLPGKSSNHCFFCWYVLTKELVKAPARAEPKSSRFALPLAPDPNLISERDENGTRAFALAFDGKTVFLVRPGTVLPPLDKGRFYLLEVSGKTLTTDPPEQMKWAEYQSWLDRLRSEGYEFTTRNFSACRSGCS